MGRRLLRLLCVMTVIAIGTSVFWSLGTDYFSVVKLEAPESITLTFVQKSVGDRAACEKLGDLTASISLAKCPTCKVQSKECQLSLAPELDAWLTEAPITLPSARIQNGIIAFSHPERKVAEATCLESQRQSSGSQFICDLPGVPRPIPAGWSASNDGMTSWLLRNGWTLLAGFFISIFALIALQSTTVRHPVETGRQEMDPTSASSWKPSKLAKRILDVAISLFLLLALLPVFLLVAISIFVLEGTPVFYRSRRFISIGTDVAILKFRTMVRDATSPRHRLRERFMRDGYLDIPLNCEVYTPIGRFLERTQLVETLQLLNVLLHGMSFVGNRPLPGENIKLLSRMQGWQERFQSPAGITGLSQVVGKHNQSPEERLSLERLYSRAYNDPKINIVWVDLAIIFYTVRMLLLNQPLSLEQAYRLCGVQHRGKRD